MKWPLAFINPTTGNAEPLPTSEGWQVYYDDRANGFYWWKPNSYGIPTMRISAAGKVEFMSTAQTEQGDAIDFVNGVRYGPDNVQDGNFLPTGKGARIGQWAVKAWHPDQPSGQYLVGAMHAYRADDQIAPSATNCACFGELRAARSGTLGPVETQIEYRGIPAGSPVGTTGIRVRFKDADKEVISPVELGPRDAQGRRQMFVRDPTP